MNSIAKIIVSLVLILIGLICLGAPIPYFPGRILVRLALFGAALSGIGKIWQETPAEGEGDIFKQKNDQLDKN